MVEEHQSFKDQFQVWLSKQIPSVQIIIDISCCDEIEQFCHKSDILQQPLFEIADLQTVQSVFNSVSKNRAFKWAYAMQYKTMLSALQRYIDFVEEISTAEPETSDNTAAAEDELIIPDYNLTDTTRDEKIAPTSTEEATASSEDEPTLSSELDTILLDSDEDDIDSAPYQEVVAALSAPDDIAREGAVEIELGIDTQAEPKEASRQRLKVEQKLDNEASPDVDSDSNRTFSDQLSTNPVLYSDMLVAELPLPIRALSRLKACKITTVSDLLRTTPDTLLKISGFGAKTLNDVLNCLRAIIDENSKRTFADQLSINPVLYLNVLVAELPLPIRALNRLKACKITTVSDLLRTTPDTLLNISGFGVRTLNAVVEYLCTLSTTPTSKKESAILKTKNHSLLVMQNAESIISGDFSFAEVQDLTEEIQQEIDSYKEAFETIGQELAFECYKHPDNIIPLVAMFLDFNAATERQKQFLSLAESIPSCRLNNRAANYIYAFTGDKSKQNLLLSLCESSDSTIKSMASTACPKNKIHEELLIRFLKWCTFDLSAEIDDLFRKMLANPRTETVIRMRTRKKTLEQVGHIFGVTRERIRQIELKSKREFNRYQSRIKIILKIAAEKNGAVVLTPADIEEYCPNNFVELLYFLRDSSNAYYTYDKQLDAFIVGDTPLQERVQSYLETLPDIFKTSQLSDLQEDAEENYDIPRDILAKSIADAFHLTGEVYHRTRLSLSKIYSTILEKYYQEGIRAYDPDELQTFRALVYKEFGEVGLPENDRALTARISNICVLCGRGMYRPRRERYISKQLTEHIHQYIEDSEHTIFLMNSLFSVFENELNAEGITNKYYLQGVLRELFSDEYFFRRDYLSKDEYTTSVYSAIVSFIKKSEYPVQKQQIQQAFPGITEIVITLSVSDSEVLNYFGSYLHASRLNFSPRELSRLEEILQGIVSDHAAHHSSEVYDIIEQKMPGLFSRNAAMFQYSAFSVLEYLFQTVFQFSRPYIAEFGVEIGRPGERLHELIYSGDEFEVSDIKEFCKEHRFQIQCLLDYINSCNDRFLMKDIHSMVSIESAGITEVIAFEMENTIARELFATQPISQITCWNRLPKINIPWTDWLIYSVLNKWGQKLSVSTSSNQLRIAVPLVAPYGQMDTEAFKDVSPEQISQPFMADDLDNIDDLIADLIDLDEDI